jgi:L-asparaginase II
MENPVLVEVTRGNRVESRHRGMIAVVDGDGSVVWSKGDIDSAVFPRSACKAMQALPLVESGAADAYGFGDKELAFAGASHSGEAAHVSLAASMLARAGLSEDDLECGAHWSFYQPVAIEQARELAAPTALHNNCSGKHSGFLCACAHSGTRLKGYVGYEHPFQGELRGIMENLTGSVHDADICGTDGCSIPTYAIPLKNLAHGFAKMATGTGLEPVRARAAKRLLNAAMAEPFYVAGTKRFCTRLMEAVPGKVFAKVGAEGVYCAVLPEKGIAVALKCEDGAERAANAMVAGTLARFFEDGSEEQTALLGLANHAMHNWNGIHVGDVRIAGPLAD